MFLKNEKEVGPYRQKQSSGDFVIESIEVIPNSNIIFGLKAKPKKEGYYSEETQINYTSLAAGKTILYTCICDVVYAKIPV